MKEETPYNPKGFGGRPPVPERAKPKAEKKTKSLFGEPLLSLEDVSSAAGTVKRALVDDTITQPSSREYQTENTGGNLRALGTGKSWTNNIDFYTDRAQQATQLVAGAMGRPVSNSILDSQFSKSGGFARNVGTGMALGIASNVVGGAVGDEFDDTSELENDLAAARYHGDDDVQARIMQKINEQKTYGSDARTMGDAVSKGTNAGWWGMLTGAVAGSGVVGLRHAMGGEQHMSYDAEFMKGIKARKNSSINAAFSGEGSDITPSEALDMILSQVDEAKGKDWDASIPSRETLMAMHEYVKKNPEPELFEKYKTLTQKFMEHDSRFKNEDEKKAYEARHNVSRERLKSKYPKK